MEIKIIQGHSGYAPADINIVVDVIRAFTVAHTAFSQGVKKIWLTNDAKEAFAWRASNNDVVLAGEIEGIKIDGFDHGNSPCELTQSNITGKTLVMKTTNGVKSTLNAEKSQFTFVVGLVNADATAKKVKALCEEFDFKKINIIASSPDGDEDLACAEYIQSIILGENRNLRDVQKRIENSEAAQKFWDESRSEFNLEDLRFCAVESDRPKVLQVEYVNPPTIKEVS